MCIVEEDKYKINNVRETSFDTCHDTGGSWQRSRSLEGKLGIGECYRGGSSNNETVKQVRDKVHTEEEFRWSIYTRTAVTSGTQTNNT